jgi:benzoylsuccinyl-CoA thiolase BbsB subunit
MEKVCVIGTGIVPFGKMPHKSIVDIAWPAVKQAYEEAAIDPLAIEAVFCGTVFGGNLIGQRIMKAIGVTGLPVTNIENACSSSSAALRQGWMAVASGCNDLVLVIGVEKLTKFGGGTIPLDDEDCEVSQGLTMPALYAMRAQRYMHEFGLTERQLAQVAVKSHDHGALNPNAQLRKRFTLDEVMSARMVASPFTLVHCCPTGDGAGAVLLASEKKARALTSSPVRIVASELASGKFMNGFRDMTTPEITVRGAKQAYEMAGLGPEDIDVAEVHDAFTIAELLYYEAFGFCPRGEAYAYLDSGATSLGGRKPVNPSGGLLSRGHPVGATGIVQAAEIVRQLNGRAGAHQVEGAKIGLSHATGGGVAGFDHGACSIHIFAK